MDKKKLIRRYKENKTYQQQMFEFIDKFSEQTSSVFIQRHIFNMII